MNAEQIREAIELVERLEELLTGFDLTTYQVMQRQNLENLAKLLNSELKDREQEMLLAFAGAPMLPGMGE